MRLLHIIRNFAPNAMKNSIQILLVILSLCGLFPATLEAQGPDEAWSIREEYVRKHRHLAISEMKTSHIPASIKLAQALLESGAGRSDLARLANNHFGIKCHKEWNGPSILNDDDKPKECFRKYNNVEESYRDHSEFLKTRQRYSNLFTLNIYDYKAWAYGLKNAGYATNPVYPERLIKLIEEHRLYLYDKDSILMAETIPEPIAEPPLPDTLRTAETPALITSAGTSEEGRVIYSNNNVRYIICRAGDTQPRLAQEFDLYSWQIADFNELADDAPLTPGQVIYLERKRRKADTDFYLVKPGDDMHSISQKFAIRLNRLYKLNRLSTGMPPQPGDTIWMRKKKPSENDSGFSLFRIFNPSKK